MPRPQSGSKVDCGAACAFAIGREHRQLVDPLRLPTESPCVKFLEDILQSVQNLQQKRRWNVKRWFETNGSRLGIGSRDQYAAAKQRRGTRVADFIGWKLQSDEESPTA